MSFSLDQHLNQYLHLYADCIPVKGFARSAIYDLTRNEIFLFQSKFYDVLQYLVADKIEIQINKIKSDKTKRLIIEFIDFLEHTETVCFLEEVSMLPRIEERWDMPAIISNSIIDVDKTIHDFNKIFNELDNLGCKFVQIRSFSNLLDIKNLNNILSLVCHKSIEGVEIILRHNLMMMDDDYIQLIKDHPILTNMIVHSSPLDRDLPINFGCDEDSKSLLTKKIHFVSQIIDSQLHCGIISPQYLNAPSALNFFETKLFNGCLNRKISVDSCGDIKNCPSMPQSFGNISHTNLSDVINIDGFKDKWNIVKDQIEICKDCEFRYACSDCRAYLEVPDDIYSKPLKCGYNPYTADWKEWTQKAMSFSAIQYYGMGESEHLVFDHNPTKLG